MNLNRALMSCACSGSGNRSLMFGKPGNAQNGLLVMLFLLYDKKKNEAE